MSLQGDNPDRKSYSFAPADGKHMRIGLDTHIFGITNVNGYTFLPALMISEPCF